MDMKKLRGREGEAEAVRFLREKGFRIIGQNYACRFGEVDIIAEGGGCVVFAEVKLRKNAAFAEAREFVTAAKQEKIIKAASMWLAANETALQPRFDVIEIYSANGKTTITHIENAFE
jgi:putative endonuclease